MNVLFVARADCEEFGMKRELAYGVTTAAVLLTLGAGAALVSCESVPSLYGPLPRMTLCQLTLMNPIIGK